MSSTGGRVVILVGSPKPLQHSSSARLGKIVADVLSSKGWRIETTRVLDVLKSDAAIEAFLFDIGSADVVVLTAPLYVDGLPAPVIRLLKRIAARVAASGLREGRCPRFASILNCGFAEAAQNTTAQRILERFAARIGWTWGGGISLGSAGFVNKRVRESLGLFADALAMRGAVPEGAVERAGRKAIPSWLYRSVGNRMWKRQARKHGVLERLDARPYELK